MNISFEARLAQGPGPVIISSNDFLRRSGDTSYYRCPDCGCDINVHERNMPGGKDFWQPECLWCDAKIIWVVLMPDMTEITQPALITNHQAKLDQQF